MARESKFQTDLIKELHDLFSGCIVLKTNPNYLQGFPDLLILYQNKWAALEIKRTMYARCQPNQKYYIEMLADMSYASFIYPENREEVIYELQQAFRSSRSTRISIRK